MFVGSVALAFACGGDEGVVSSGADAGRSDGAIADARVDAEGPKDAGSDARNDPDADATIALVPSPTSVTAIAGNEAAIVTWDWAGSGPAGFQLLAHPGGAVQTTSSPRAIVRDLTNGTSYTFTVIATSTLGTSLASMASNAVVPAAIEGAPDTPSGVSATAGNGVATVTWPAPDDHGSAISRYAVMSIPDGITVTTSNRSVDVPGLKNGTAYGFTVIATNANGTSGASAVSSSVTPAGPPGPPVGVMASRGDKTATVTWTAPNSNGAPITNYTVTSSPPTSPVVTSATSANMTGLTNGTSYTFTVKANNAKGSSSPSAASNAVVPAGAPGAPTNVTATPRSGAAVVYWTAPNDNGAPLVKYTVTSNPGNHSAVSATDTAVRVSNLTNGTNYTFTVTATNAAGTSAPSSASSAISPSATGCAETSFTVTADFAYAFNGLGGNPRLTACKGQILTFHLVNVSDMHPFFIRNADGTLAEGVTNNGATGTKDVIWNVPANQAPKAYYQCAIHPSMTNEFDIQ